ncbi:MAG TPA: hypothetical protein VN540_08910, partial [Clostridia bacterium]|nr:hypothetical protein [Clostridia bacterium]
MKKLFALLLGFAMILALAAPALASGWDAIPDVAEDFEEITVKITALETEKNTAVLGSLYEELSVMYPVVKGTVVHFFVEITVPENLSEASEDLLAHPNRGLKYALVLSNLEITEAFSYVDGANKTARVPVATAAAADTETINSIVKCVYGFEYWAKGMKSGDATAAATIGFYNVWINQNSEDGPNYRVMGIDSDGDGEEDCVAEHYLPGYAGEIGQFADHSYAWFTFRSMVSGGYCYMWFPVDNSTGKLLTGLEIFMETSMYGHFAIT